MELREKIARALAAADDKDPDAPAWVSFPSGQTTGVCWRDQYADKADAILALPEIRDALAELRCNDCGEELGGAFVCASCAMLGR